MESEKETLKKLTNSVQSNNELFMIYMGMDKYIMGFMLLSTNYNNFLFTRQL